MASPLHSADCVGLGENRFRTGQELFCCSPCILGEVSVRSQGRRVQRPHVGHATTESVAVGTLLTASSLPGDAEPVTEPWRAFGAVLGNATVSLDHGTNFCAS